MLEMLKRIELTQETHGSKMAFLDGTPPESYASLWWNTFWLWEEKCG
jgi:hypothetical protein